MKFEQLLLSEPVSSPDQDATLDQAGSSNLRRGTQDTTEPSHENVSHPQEYHDEGMDGSYKAVKPGEYYPMPLDVSPSHPKLTFALV